MQRAGSCFLPSQEMAVLGQQTLLQSCQCGSPQISVDSEWLLSSRLFACLFVYNFKYPKIPYVLKQPKTSLARSKSSPIKTHLPAQAAQPTIKGNSCGTAGRETPPSAPASSRGSLMHRTHRRGSTFPPRGQEVFARTRQGLSHAEPNPPVPPTGEGARGRRWRRKAGDRAGDRQGRAEATRPTSAWETGRKGSPGSLRVGSPAGMGGPLRPDRARAGKHTRSLGFPTPVASPRLWQ